jgi:hypothetical protein
MGIVNKFASSNGGAGPTTVIGPISVAADMNEVHLTDFGATARTTAVTTTLVLQGSSDNFSSSIVSLDQIEIPTTGTVIKTYSRPIIVAPGHQFRVVATQVTPGPFSVTLLGELSDSLDNITDLV